MSKKRVIKIENIVKSFAIGERGNKVLKGISFEIYNGEFLTLFGPSGCGKTTLINTVMGIERPDQGKINILGIDLWSMNADDRANMRKMNIGVVYQQQNWIKSLTVIENVALSAQLLGFNKVHSISKAKEVIAEVGMSKFENFYPTELSSGEQQKIGLARAIISEPQVLIADEPTGNLDTKSGDEVINILKGFAKKGTTVVLVTHNPEHLNYSDRVAIIKDGYLINTLIKSDDIQNEVESLIKNTKTPKGEDIIENHRSKPENTELDYPPETLFEKIKVYSKLIIKFFLETASLLILYLLNKISPTKADTFRDRISNLFRKINNEEKITKNINSLELTEISFKNIFFKKFRTIITIVGVGIGTGFVVLLLSLGYGVEKLVVDRIAQAQDLNQVDLFPKVGSQINLNDELVEKVESISGVNTVYKIKNFPGRVDYKGSTVDLVVYGVEEGYLESAPMEILSGGYFSSDSNSTDALVNKEYLDMLDLDTELIGETLNLSVIQSSPDNDVQTDSIQIDVVGVVEDDSSPVLYLQIEGVTDFTSTNYSEATAVLNKDSSLAEVRKQIESLGLETFSVMDTINQVQTLFAYLRLSLLVFGVMAFTISFLGMINILMVSLLERTREVGLMKIIGVKRNEIRFIFIIESMLIASLGGFLGILFGIVGGYAVSLLVYLFSMGRGVEFLMVSYLPVHLVIIVIVCTTVLGFFTGLYPANRAVKIPPLDALRYE